LPSPRLEKPIGSRGRSGRSERSCHEKSVGRGHQGQEKGDQKPTPQARGAIHCASGGALREEWSRREIGWDTRDLGCDVVYPGVEARRPLSPTGHP
jgi:hypothetical protein